MTQMAQLLKSSKGAPWYGDYTPSSLVNSGDVVVIGNTLMICTGGAQVNGAGTGISANTIGAMAVRGGYFLVAVDATLPAPRSRVYWDPVNVCVTSKRGTNIVFGYMGDVQATASGQLVPVEFEPGGNDDTVTTTAATGAGSANTDAAPIGDGINIITGANATVGIVLPTPWAGRTLKVKNNANAVLKVWPNSTNQINAITAGAAMSMAAYASATFWSDGTNWYSIPTTPS